MRFILIALALLATPSIIFAREGDDRRYASIWIVQPNAEAVGRHTVRPGDFIFRQRLLPPTLVRLDSDARDAGSGALIAAAGSQLFGLITEGPPIYCVAGRRSATALMQDLIGGPANRQICLVDMDRDGRLDSHFAKGNWIRGVPSIEGRRPNRMDAVTGGTYTAIPPTEMIAHYFVGLRYMGSIVLTYDMYFQIAWGDDGGHQTLPDAIVPIRHSDPPLVQVRGAELVVAARRPGEMDVDVRSAFPPAPFFVRLVIR